MPQNNLIESFRSMIVNLTNDKKFFSIESCSKEEYEQLKIAYTKKADNYRFNPRYKKGLWDGNITFVKGGYIPSGTWNYLKNLSISCKWEELKINGLSKLFDTSITIESFTEWCNTFFKDLSFKPRDYQINSAFNILKYKRCLAELATSAGKTLICFMVIAYLIDNKLIQGNILMIVPSIQLVVQSFGDFSQYNTNKLPLIIQQAYAGFVDNPKSNITIGTFQTLTKQDENWFNKFDCIICDETHRSTATSIKNILDKCWHSEYRFGVSGTMPKENSASFLTLETYLGPVITSIKAKELQDSGYISNCNIVQMRLNYISDEKKYDLYNAYKLLVSNKNGSSAFNLESNFIMDNEKRFNFICNLISKTTKNTLVLFHHIKYGKKLFNKLTDSLKNKRVYYIDGMIDKNMRKEITNRMDKYDDVILVASFATLSTGVSVNNIYNVIFVESFKSPYIIIQSIGRGLRLKDKVNTDKNKATIVDLVDDFRYDKYMNYLYRHGLDRMKMYKEHQYPVTMKKIIF